MPMGLDPAICARSTRSAELRYGSDARPRWPERWAPRGAVAGFRRRGHGVSQRPAAGRTAMGDRGPALRRAGRRTAAVRAGRAGRGRQTWDLVPAAPSFGPERWPLGFGHASRQTVEPQLSPQALGHCLETPRRQPVTRLLVNQRPRAGPRFGTLCDAITEDVALCVGPIPQRMFSLRCVLLHQGQVGYNQQTCLVAGLRRIRHRRCGRRHRSIYSDAVMQRYIIPSGRPYRRGRARRPLCLTILHASFSTCQV